MFDIADARVYTDLDAGVFLACACVVAARGLALALVEVDVAVVAGGRLARRRYQRWIRIRHRGFEVQHAAHGDRVVERAGVKAEERRSAVREGRGAAERELERLLEQVSAEDHEVVSVAVLGLHDLRGTQRRVGHVDNMFGPLLWVCWVCFPFDVRKYRRPVIARLYVYKSKPLNAKSVVHME